MAIIYAASGGTPIIPFHIIYDKPLSEIQVLNDVQDLTNRNGVSPLYYISVTGIPKNYCHDGMYISIVEEDETSENNGIWFLSKKDSCTEMYSSTSPHGWRKLAFADETSTSSVAVDRYTIKDGNGVAEQDDSQVEGLRVVRVDGGSFSDGIQ